MKAGQNVQNREPDCENVNRIAETSTTPARCAPPPPVVRFTVPVRTRNPNNVPRGFSRNAAFARMRENRDHRQLARMLCLTALQHARQRPGELVPCVVHFVRLTSAHLDYDGIVACCKRIQDGVADALGIDDGGPFWRATYAERRVRRGVFGVEVTIEKQR